MDVKDLNEKQLKILKEFKAELGSRILPGHDDRDLIKWLVARDFQIPKSKAMYLKSMEWRKRIGIDDIFTWEKTAPEVLKKYYAGGVVGEDKDGHPVYVDLVSFMDIKGLLHSVQMNDILKYETLQLEKIVRATKENSKKYGRRIDQCTVIMDLSKLSMKHFRKNYIKMYNDMMQMHEDNYPEYLRQVFIINAPKIFPLIFNLVKPFLSEDTRRKINILGSNWKERILQAINADQVPKYWGGTKVDPDGDEYCRSLIKIGGDIPESYYLNNDDDSAMTTVTIPRKTQHQVEMVVDRAGSSIRYQFRTEEYDIGFGVFESDNPNAKLSDMKEVIPVEKANSHLVTQDGVISCTKTGKYVLVFDNKYSMVNSKKLLFNVELLRPDEEETDIQGEIIDIRL